MKLTIPIVLLLNVLICCGLFGGCDRPDPFYEEIFHQKTKSTFEPILTFFCEKGF